MSPDAAEERERDLNMDVAMRTASTVGHALANLLMPVLGYIELSGRAPDPRLDDAYEEKLKFSGDNLLPITSVDSILETFLGIRPTSTANVPPKAASNGSTSAATAAAFDVAKFKEEFVPKDEPVELPVLSSDPTEAELLEFASAHPTVRLAKRVFRWR